MNQPMMSYSAISLETKDAFFNKKNTPVARVSDQWNEYYLSINTRVALLGIMGDLKNQHFTIENNVYSAVT